MKLQGKKVLLLSGPIYEDLELHYPRLRLLEEGAQVHVAGLGEDRYEGKHGYPVEPDVQIDDVRAEDYDGLVVPGGYAPDHMRRNESLLRVVRKIYEAGKPVAAICHAAWVPISAGILEGKTMTCYVAIKDDVENAGATYVDESVVVDGNLITSRHPGDLPDFCRALIEALSVQATR